MAPRLRIALLAHGLAVFSIPVPAQIVSAQTADDSPVAERFVLWRVEVLGSQGVSSAEVLHAFGFANNSTVTLAEAEEARLAVERLLRARGYERAQVRLELRAAIDPGRRVAYVHIIEGTPTRIASVELEGDALPSEHAARVQSLVGARVDEEAIEIAVRETVRDLREGGYYEATLSARVRETDETPVRLRLVSHMGPRYELVLRGTTPLTDESIRESLPFREEALVPRVLRPVALRVEDLFHRLGHLDARVNVRAIGGERAAVLHIDANAGPLVRIADVVFPGAVALDESFLRDQVFGSLDEALVQGMSVAHVDSYSFDVAGRSQDSNASSASVIPRGRVREAPDPHTVFYPPAYAEAQTHIRDLFQARGYTRVRVGDPELRRVQARDGRFEATVVIPIEQGVLTLLAEARILGNRAVSGAAIADAMHLYRDDPYAHLSIEEARVRIADLYRERGYFFAEVEVESRLSADASRAILIFSIQERSPVRIRDIVIRGAARTSPDLIRERITIRSGDLLRPSQLTASQERLTELGIFSSVTLAPAEADVASALKDVVVAVVERTPQFTDGSIGVSTGQGARGSFEYGYRNLFGVGVGLNLAFRLAYQFFSFDPVIEERYRQLSLADRLERTLQVGIVLPHVSWLPNTRVSLELSHIRDNERDFGVQKNTALLGVAWRPLPRFTVSPAGSIENNDVTIFTGQDLDRFLSSVGDPRLQRFLRVPRGESTLMSLRTTLTLDLRNNPFVPTSGTLVSATAEYARTLDSEQFIINGRSDQFVSEFVRVSASASVYVPVTRDVVFAAQFRFGRVIHLTNASRTYPDRQFFLGGVESMRGFLQDALIPEDIYSSLAGTQIATGILRGGDVFVLLRAELRFPLLGPLQGAVFADIGNLWNDPARLDLLRLRPTAGLGIRFATPVGPVALDYGFVLDRRADVREPVGSFHISVGVF